MAARYLAAWVEPARPDKPVREHVSPREWLLAVERPNLMVWVRRDRPLPIHQFANGVVVIGRLFGLPASNWPTDDLANWLCREAWGAYAAILPEREAPPLVLRDPSGARDAITWRRAAACFLSDDLEALPVHLWPKDLALDWDAVTDFVRRPLSASSILGLRGLSAITPGAVQPMGGGGERVLWKPADLAARKAPVDAQGALRETVEATVEAMARQAGPLMVETSGGLDSSIVATCLGQVARAGRADVRMAVNQYVVDREGDERVWARAVCEAAGVPLTTIEKPVGKLARADFIALGGGVRPAMDALDPIRDRHYLQLARTCGAASLMTGQGGDAVFFQMPTALVVADLVAAEGLGSAFDSRSLAVARWLRRPIWSVLYEAGLKTPLPGARATARFWGPRARRKPATVEHAWLEPGSAAPGKRLHVRHITLGQLKFGRSLRGDELDVLHPLLAQPVVELCLSIPTWDLVLGGRDRGLARAAFARRLPSGVVHRRSKGILARLYTQRVASSLDVLRPWLLDGVLAEAGVIDRAAIAQALTPEDLIWAGDGFRLFQVAMVEGWVRVWKSRLDQLTPEPRSV